MPATAKPVALIILDGWGISTRPDADATQLAEAPVIRRLLASYPRARLQAAGEAVGLPDGVIGNSEVGHLNLGAGRIVYQDLTRINLAIRDESFFTNPALCQAMEEARRDGGALHLIGLVSPAGVHSHTDHLAALLGLAKRKGLERVYVHAITDGRDSDPRAGAGYVAEVQGKARSIGCGQVASVTGRYYTMDRDKRWERTKRGYDAIVRGQAPLVEEPIAAIRRSYDEGVTDEFLEPFCVRGPDGGPLATVRSGDAVVYFNFRADRARQLTRALTDPAFDAFERADPPPQVHFVSMTRYDETFDLPVAFPPQPLEDIFATVAARHGLAQLRVAETEKYAHVTYFFNGGDEAPFPGEERILVPSARDVPTYDLLPEMRAAEITDEALARLAKGPLPDVMVLNYANADMVAHTGKLAETCRAVETVDRNLGRLLEGIVQRGGVALVTADHGNAEQMVDPESGEPHTAHTLNPVPVVLVDERRRGEALRDGLLADVAPTLLELLGLPQPAAMTGRSLLRP